MAAAAVCDLREPSNCLSRHFGWTVLVSTSAVSGFRTRHPIPAQGLAVALRGLLSALLATSAHPTRRSYRVDPPAQRAAALARSWRARARVLLAGLRTPSVH